MKEDKQNLNRVCRSLGEWWFSKLVFQFGHPLGDKLKFKILQKKMAFLSDLKIE